MKPSIIIIGAGKLGKTLGKLFADAKLVTINNVLNSTIKSSQDAVDFIGAGVAAKSFEDIAQSDIYLITTPDNQIKKTCVELNKYGLLREGNIVFHCSGSLSASEVLTDAVNNNCYIASIHPMRSFADPANSVNEYTGTYCAVEGDTQALNLLVPMFTNIGATCFDINSNKKGAYHAAGVFGSNYVVTLAHAAMQSLESAGVDSQLCIEIITNLMKNTVSNLEKTKSTRKALTGPIQRGDAGTISKHIAALPTEQLIKLYKILGVSTLELATLTDKQLAELAALIKNKNL